MVIAPPTRCVLGQLIHDWHMGNMGNIEPWGETWPVHLGLWVAVLSEMTLAYLRSIPMALALVRHWKMGIVVLV
jgi:hypothetical protein